MDNEEEKGSTPKYLLIFIFDKFFFKKKPCIIFAECTERPTRITKEKKTKFC